MGRVRSARAHWLRRDVIAWNGWIGPGVTHQLESLPLIHDPRGLPDDLRARFPHLRDFHALRVAPESFPKIPEVLRGEVVVSAMRDGEMLDATAAQIAGVLDDLYVWDGPLGVSWSDGTPAVRLWAPTARSVRILFPDGKAEAMSFHHGVWTIQGTPRWRDRFYRFEVEVYTRSTGRIEKNLVTDPYSLSVGTNSQWSQIADLDDPRLKPEGWDHFSLPPLERFEDIVIYELHVRDFSMSDPAVPPELRGTYLAFTQEDSFGMRHLRSLAEAGLTHVHLLPVFDFASVQDNRAEHRHPGDLSGFPPDSPQQQKAILRIKDLDGFNWGYDPLHFTVPEGSYATDPNGCVRIREFRAMVKSLAAAGLRVVMDVVFNHTYTAGQEETSVLDRIVPGYYHRLSGEGMVETSSCCPNTATENAMMEKLMIDSVRTWAKAYRIDAFRFDLMGHHLKSNMLKVREALGPGRYIYGEGWDFGEMAQNARGVNATQRNLAGAGIGTFNDRFRDAIRGGGPFGGLRDQGFATGLAADPQNIVRDGLAGSMEITGGFRKSAVESVNYAAAHDNETLFDVIQLKAPQDAGLNERARMNNLALSVIMLAQGIPFFHAGDELLRSKSFDRNSFNSGDWFNRLDFTMQSTAFGAGLPPEHENGKHWDLMRPLLADPSLRPSPAHIRRASEHFLEMLRIRKSNPLFRLSDQRSIAEHLRFLSSESGTIALVLRSERELILVAINAHRTAKTMHLSDLAGLPLALHAVLQRSSDEIVRQTRFDQATGSLAIPALTAVVLGSLLPRAA